MDVALAQGMENTSQTPRSTDHEVILTRAYNSDKFSCVKKIINTLQITVLAIGFAFALTGCGEKEPPNPLEHAEPPDPEKPDIPGEDED